MERPCRVGETLPMGGKEAESAVEVKMGVQGQYAGRWSGGCGIEEGATGETLTWRCERGWHGIATDRPQLQQGGSRAALSRLSN